MGQNLKARLAYIRGTAGFGNDEKQSARENEFYKKEQNGILKDTSHSGQKSEQSFLPLWKEAGYKTLKRVLKHELSVPLPFSFPPSMAVVVPDFICAEKIPCPEQLLFFDLETTGLGGAGTVAFLAAFGRFRLPCLKNVCSGEALREIRLPVLEITQYLLLDYPGESDFIENAVKEFSPSSVVVSYNGKSFDSQILKSRCLMNGIMPPEYRHADLLHPARRLWKRRLPDCSQATIEVSALGIDRSGDVPGALAPDIWFSFLRTGKNNELLGICDHNVSDIKGLAALFLSMAEIAANPFESLKKFRFDEEALALSWYNAVRRNVSFLGEAEKKTGRRLLEEAANKSFPFAALVMAKEAEWRLRDAALALGFTKSALAHNGLSQKFAAELEKRKKRLEEKLAPSLIK